MPQENKRIKTGIQIRDDKLWIVGPVGIDRVKEAVMALDISREQKRNTQEVIDQTRRDVQILLQEGGLVALRSIYKISPRHVPEDTRQTLVQRGIIECRINEVGEAIGQPFNEKIDAPLDPSSKFSAILFKPNAHEYLSYSVTAAGAIGAFYLQPSNSSRPELLWGAQSGVITPLSVRLDRIYKEKNIRDYISSRAVVGQSLVELAQPRVALSNSSQR